MRLRRWVWLWIAVALLLLAILGYSTWSQFPEPDPKILAQLTAEQRRAWQTIPEGFFPDSPPRPGDPCYELQLLQYKERQDVHNPMEYQRFISRVRQELIAGRLTILFWAVALVVSVLYGWKAVEIFTDVSSGPTKPPPSWWWHQRWLNFLGSLVGWIAVWVLTRRFSSCLFGPCTTEPNRWDVGAAFVGFVGVTGYLPFTVVGAISGVAALASKAADLIKNLVPRAPDGERPARSFTE